MLSRLESASDRQRQFMADASHELRTPLANIRTAVEVAQAHPSTVDTAALEEDVLQQTARLERLTQDLLVLAAGDVERSVTPRSELVDLARVVDLELQRPSDAVSVHRLGQPGPVLVDADRQEMTRALSNLIDNARRHAKSNVTVGLRSGARWAEIWVSDDGPGIPRAQRERVFERFVRLDAHRDRADGGVGLGLAIARDVTQRNGGTLTLDPHGDGATFRIRIPLAANSATTATAAAQRSLKSTPVRSSP
jgi:signal transduction histidine kinase